MVLAHLFIASGGIVTLFVILGYAAPIDHVD
jgi:hypothetical protein